MQIPRQTAVYKNSNAEFKNIPVMRYKLNVYETENNTVTRLIEQVLNEDGATTDSFCNTGKKNEFDIFDVFGELVEIHENKDFVLNHKRKTSTIDEQVQVTRAFYNSPLLLEYTLKDGMSYELGFSEHYKKLKDFINSFNDVNLSDFQIIAKYYNFNFDYSIFNFSGYEKAKNGDLIEQYSSAIFNVSDGSVLDLLNKKHTNKIHISYTCGTLLDVLFAILHYYKLKGYKLNRCKHCNKYFPVINLKETLCNRKSPLNGYTDKTCKEARKKMWDKLQHRKNNLKSRLVNNLVYDYEDFVTKTIQYEDIARESPTPQNLQSYHDFLYIECEKIYKKYERVKH